MNILLKNSSIGSEIILVYKCFEERFELLTYTTPGMRYKILLRALECVPVILNGQEHVSIHWKNLEYFLKDYLSIFFYDMRIFTNVQYFTESLEII